ncbi:ATP-binding protein [Streptomyces sp. NPDC042319]|uniref:ATP-binding protein n=1 Tax=Streptomyces sp. NPDC042319 TaxID=3154332 RepID=UPI0033CEC91E
MKPPTPTTHVLWCWTKTTPDAPARARTVLRCALEQLGCQGDVLDDSVLAASELVGNACEHAVGPYELHLGWSRAGLVCEVHDHDARIPERPAAPATPLFEPNPEDRGGGLDALRIVLGERGRGLHIVDQLTSGAWGFRLSPSSTEQLPVKIAWMVIRP